MYIADLHIHSHYSRATSKECTPEYLHFWAKKKGIQIIGAGDFTHPAWREELRTKLTRKKDGFYQLKEEYWIPETKGLDGQGPFFVISGEISSIYKKNGKVRKVHNLIILPSLEAADRLAKKLEAIGNIHSDGRPILGLDCRDLLEITMEICPEAIFIPAHIWTPHFSLFGAFSGFDSIEECFGDMTPYIHALETGLSSDPPMNWRISALDSYQLVSNSDAHSPSKLGREANLLNISLSYDSFWKAIQLGEGLLGTIEFFPEEGKYHFDGHRKCNLCLNPAQTRMLDGKCPVCGKKITIGVQHRVEQLADREENYILSQGKPFESIVPLAEIIAAATKTSPSSKKTAIQYEAMLRRLGSEFTILRETPVEEIKRNFGTKIAEGIHRIRKGQVLRTPGFDGEYGKILLWKPWELDTLEGQLNLFSNQQLDTFSKETAAGREENKVPACFHKEEDKNAIKNNSEVEYATKGEEKEDSMNEEQKYAIEVIHPEIAVIAGPGTGKTKTLVARILFLLEQRGKNAEEITALTFTNQAAKEVRQRVEKRLGKKAAKKLLVGTFHSICYQMLGLKEKGIYLADDIQAEALAEETKKEWNLSLSGREFLRAVSLRKTGLGDNAFGLKEEAFSYYQTKLNQQGLIDFDDLLLAMLTSLREGKLEIRNRFSYLFVDEFQDCNPLQYELIKTFHKMGKELFVIGDRDQAIYGFRGADGECFAHLQKEYPDQKIIKLNKNYRSTPEIIQCALASISNNRGESRELIGMVPKGQPVRWIHNKGAHTEGIAIAKEINQIIGGIDMLDVHLQAYEKERKAERSFSDIAVLYRTHKQETEIELCLKKEGIPYVVAGKDEFLMDPKVQGTILFFRWLLNEADLLSLKGCLKLVWNIDWKKEQETNKAEDFGKKMPESFEKLTSELKQEVYKRKPYKILEKWAETWDWKEQEAFQKFLHMSVFYQRMEEFLQSLAFGQESDLKRSSTKRYGNDAVTLMTFHGAKGLEFPVVFLAGLTKGMFPLEFQNQSAELEEERRLFYVGLTRAKEELILSSYREPSVFIKEIPEQYFKKEEAQKKRKSSNGEQLSLFDFDSFS